MDSTLSYSYHVNAISKSANFYLRKIRHIRNYCSTNITKRLVNYLVLSRLDYCCSLFYGIKKTEVKKLTIIRSSIRLILRLKRCEHSLTDMHKYNMKWSPFKKRSDFRLLRLMHKTLIIGIPGYRRGSIVRRQIIQYLHSSDTTVLELLNGCNAMQSRSFSRIAPARWNILPYYLRKLKSPRTFAYCLKHYLN